MKQIKESEYYSLMSHFNIDMDFNYVHEKWYKCFHFILRDYHIGYTDKIIHSLFYNFSFF
jgi:hypothetical protein